MSGAAGSFDAAKSITELLQKLERGQQELVLRWVREALGLTKVPPVPAPEQSEHTTARPDSVTEPPKDIKTFLGEKQPKSDMQFAAVVAYYYRFVAPEQNRRELIDSDALQEAARHAGRARLAKPHITLNNAKNQGYLDKSGRGEFKINTVGENLVAVTLPGGLGSADGSATRPRRRNSAPKKITRKRK